jgi:hypothetical protein
MACVPIPPLPLIELPPGITLGASVPTLSFDETLCCKIASFSFATPPIPLPPLVLQPAIIATINTALAALAAYHASLPFDCPLE